MANSLKRARNNAYLSSKSAKEYDLRVSGLTSTTENTRTTFRTHNAVEGAFKRRNISNGREITIYFRLNQRMIAICGVPGLTSTLENACTALHKHNAVKRALKRRNISNGRETRLHFRQNRRVIAICGVSVLVLTLKIASTT